MHHQVPQIFLLLEGIEPVREVVVDLEGVREDKVAGIEPGKIEEGEMQEAIHTIPQTGRNLCMQTKE